MKIHRMAGSLLLFEFGPIVRSGKDYQIHKYRLYAAWNRPWTKGKLHVRASIYRPKCQ